MILKIIANVINKNVLEGFIERSSDNLLIKNVIIIIQYE
jgi:hypothetical protein